MNTSTVIIAGGRGFLGMNLARFLLQDTERDWTVIILTRTPPADAPGIRYVQWDARSLGDWAAELDGAAAIVNLTGRSVDCIKSPDHCDEILRSRVESTRIIGEAIRAATSPPPVWVQMSTAHIYGDPPAGITITEDSAFGYGLAPDVGRAWEDAHAEAMQHLPDVRKVVLRTSFVVGRSGGAIPRLETLVRFGLGGTIGEGTQGMSWLHERDMNRIMHRAIVDADMTGPYIATAPNPVSQREFMRTMRQAIGQPIGLPAFEWMVRIGAPLLMRTDAELALYGRYCIPQRLIAEGFEFDFDDLEAAMRNLYTRD